MKILIIEDLPSDYMLTSRIIKKTFPDSELKDVDNKDDFIRQLELFQPNIILSDICVPGFDWLTAFRIASAKDPSVPFFIVSGMTDKSTANECLRLGAQEFISKDNLELIGPAILKSLKER